MSEQKSAKQLLEALFGEGNVELENVYLAEEYIIDVKNLPLSPQKISEIIKNTLGDRVSSSGRAGTNTVLVHPKQFDQPEILEKFQNALPELQEKFSGKTEEIQIIDDKTTEIILTSYGGDISYPQKSPIKTRPVRETDLGFLDLMELKEHLPKGVVVENGQKHTFAMHTKSDGTQVARVEIKPQKGRLGAMINHMVKFIAHEANGTLKIERVIVPQDEEYLKNHGETRDIMEAMRNGTEQTWLDKTLGESNKPPLPSDRIYLEVSAVADLMYRFLIKREAIQNKVSKVGKAMQKAMDEYDQSRGRDNSDPSPYL